MTIPPEMKDHSATEPPGNTYYAVRPDLVLAAIKWFGIQPGILEKGAKKVFDKARRLDDGKESGRWGHHHQSVIELFCSYTQERDYVLPWEDLVEDVLIYDGKEGVSTRTGNKPLNTVTRVSVDGDNAGRARNKLGYELSEIARESGLPISFLKAIESRDWNTVSKPTAQRLCSALQISLEELEQNRQESASTQIRESNSGAGDTEEDSPDFDVVNHSSTTRVRRSIYLGLVVALLFVVAGMFITVREQTQIDGQSGTTIANIQLDNTHWFATIELLDDIYIPEDLMQFWTNGTYVYFRKDGTIGFNTNQAGQYYVLPHPENGWRVDDNQLLIMFPDIQYQFDLNAIDTDEWHAYSHDRVFRMSMRRIK